MSNKVQELNAFKGVVSHPNSISAPAGTFRDIKNGWHLRDGMVDKRPGFDLNNSQQKPPGFLSQFTGLKTIGDFTFVRQDQTIGVYSPTTGYVQLTGADATDAYQCTTIEVGLLSLNGAGTNTVQCLIVGKQLTSATKSDAFITVYKLTTRDGVLFGEIVDRVTDPSTSTAPIVSGIACYRQPVNSPIGIYGLYVYSRADTNKIYLQQAGINSPTWIVGNGTAGFSTGSSLKTLAIGPTFGMTLWRDTGTGHDHIYACVPNGILDLDINASTSTLVAGDATSGNNNGTGGTARFTQPLDIDYFLSSPNNFYVTDSLNNSIRLVTKAGVVTNFATGIATPAGLTCLSPLSGSNASPLIYVNSLGLRKVLSYTVGGTMSVVAGNGTSGYIDGVAASAEFNSPYGLAIWQDANVNNNAAESSAIKIFAADETINVIRSVDIGQNVATVSTFAGNAAGGYLRNNSKTGYIGGILTVPSNNPLNSAQFTTPGSPFYGESGFSMFELNSTIYLNTSRGVVSFDTASLENITSSNIIRYAGAPQGYDLSLTLVGSPGTLLAADFAVGYRIVWGYKTAAGKVILGPPSSLAIIANPTGAGSAKNVQIVSVIPPTVDTTWTYQLYRTLTNFVNTASGTPVPPGDTEFLVYEASPTLTDLAAGSITITDSTPDALVGAALYTNATQETLSQANTPPPQCLDMCLFNGMGIYANTVQKGTLFLNLVSVTGLSGSGFTIQSGNFGFGLVGGASENPNLFPGTAQFQVFTTGTTAANIQNTAQSIVRMINSLDSYNYEYFAQYVSTYNGTPGQIAITAKSLGDPTFWVRSGASLTQFSPPIPTTNGTYASVAETVPNGLYVSKPLQPDAVPLVNNFQVGTSSDSIRRVFALRTSCIIIKERSVWRLTGDDPSNISISLLDNTVSLRAGNSATLLNNEVYALTTQGVVAISDNGVRIISRDIEFQLTQITGQLQAPLDLMNCCNGFGSDDWRIYFLSIFESDDRAATWCYSPFSNTWARWDLIVYALTVTDGQIIAACIDDPNASQTLKSLNPYLVAQNMTPPIQNASPYADGGGIATISAPAVTNGQPTVQIAYSGQPIDWFYQTPQTPTAGWAFVFNGDYYYILGDPDGGGNYPVSSIFGLGSSQSAAMFRPIDFFLRCNPINAGVTFNAKQWSDFILALESKNAYQFTAGFLQNYSPEGTAFLTQTKVLNQLQPAPSMGSSPTPEDANLYLEQVQRLSIPKQVLFGNMLEWTFSHSEAFAELVVKAVGIETRGTESTKVQQ